MNVRHIRRLLGYGITFINDSKLFQHLLNLVSKFHIGTGYTYSNLKKNIEP